MDFESNMQRQSQGIRLVIGIVSLFAIVCYYWVDYVKYVRMIYTFEQFEWNKITPLVI